jgi:hypothetical protein
MNKTIQNSCKGHISNPKDGEMKFSNEDLCNEINVVAKTIYKKNIQEIYALGERAMLNYKEKGKTTRILL